MPIDSGFDYARLLSFDRAKVIGRTRENDLGAYELSLQYNLQTSKAREDALEWLEANRLEFSDQIINGRTYEGKWHCTTIGYNQDAKVIAQVFKKDVGVGDLGDIPPEPITIPDDYNAQSGDLARISDGMEIERSYYWRVTNPEDYELPSTEIEGQIWTKTANDNGDGTYDITISREVAKNQEAVNEVQFGGESNPSSDIVVSGAGSGGVNGTYSVTGTQDGKNIWYNGSYYISWRVGDVKWFITQTTLLGLIYYEVASASDFPPTSGWSRIVGADPTPTLVIGSGNGGPYNEVTDIDTNDVEKEFGVNVTDAVDGEIKTVSNTPLENGKYRTSVTTRTAKPIRMPTSEGSFFAYGSDFLITGKAIIIGRNRTYEQFTADTQLLGFVPYLYRINNTSVRINDFGLYDYTITSNEPS